MRSRERSKFESLIGAVAVWLETGEASKEMVLYHFADLIDRFQTKSPDRLDLGFPLGHV